MSTPPPVSLCWVRQSLGDVPRGDDWLTPGERAQLATLRVPKRRADWRLGRWTAKRAVAWLEGYGDPRRVAILAAADGAPAAWCDGARARATISISHSDGHGLCVATRAACALGCDIETVAERSAAFVRDYFTPAEQALVADADASSRPGLATLLWSAKEAALKALREGLRMDTRAVAVGLAAGSPVDGWQPLTLVLPAAHCRFSGWWRRDGDRVLTIASSPPADAPRELPG